MLVNYTGGQTQNTDIYQRNFVFRPIHLQMYYTYNNVIT